MMKKIIVVAFMLSGTQLYLSACAADTVFVPKKYIRSPQNRRDYTGLVHTVDEKTKLPLKVSSKEAIVYRKSAGEDKYACTYFDCLKPLGRSGRGMTASGFKQHFDRQHMGLRFQCMSCEECFKSGPQCYQHVQECASVLVEPPLRESWATIKVEKPSHQSPAGKAKINSPLIKYIRSERRKNKGLSECLMCSLVYQQYKSFTSFDDLEEHREMTGHEDAVAGFMTGKGKYKDLQTMHKELNRELP